MSVTEIKVMLPTTTSISSEVTTVGGTTGNPRWVTTISFKVQSKIRFVDHRAERCLKVRSQQQEEFKEAYLVVVIPHGGERELREG